jgi:radical SAM enzyme (TIGR01210 family)
MAVLDHWIVERRPTRLALNPFIPYAFSLEDECSESGEVVPVATILLTNKECPWRCLMCDLWKNTLLETVPVGAIPTQIDHALGHLGPARQIKLYNSGSFFDRQAIPVQDYASIAERVNSFEKVIVESHPALLGESCLRFRDLLKGRLEVAMGLETAQPDVLARLNKGMTVEQFATAAEWLHKHDIDLRVFILVKPPFLNDAEALYWAERSLDFAFDCGAGVASLIPTRGGNGALDELAANGEFSPPRMGTLEAAADYGIRLRRGRVFADLWDLERISSCDVCYGQRRQRLNNMNLRQQVEPPVVCSACQDT